MNIKKIDHAKELKHFINTMKELNINPKKSNRLTRASMKAAAHRAMDYYGRGLSPEGVKAHNDKLRQEQISKGNKSRKPDLHYSIKPNTYKNYMSDYRNALKALNFKDINLPDNVTKLKADFPDIDFSGLDYELPKLRDELEKLRGLPEVKLDADLYKRLKHLNVEHFTFPFFKASELVLDGLNNTSKENRKTKMENKKFITHRRFDDALKTLKTSNHWVDLAVWCGLVSGRRSIEILRYAEFVAKPNKCVLFSGQVKACNRSDVEPYIIPVHVPTKTFLEVHSRLREMLESVVFCDKPLPELSDKQINGAVAKLLGDRVSTLFGNNEMTFKDTRVIYAIYAMERGLSLKNEVDSVFFSRILGHGKLDMDTQNTYKTVSFDDALPELPAIEFTQRKPHPKQEHSEILQLSIIKGFDSRVDEHKSKAVKRIHKFVKQSLMDKPDVLITKSYLGKNSATGKGHSSAAVIQYFELIGLIES